MDFNQNIIFLKPSNELDKDFLHINSSWVETFYFDSPFNIEFSSFYILIIEKLLHQLIDRLLLVLVVDVNEGVECWWWFFSVERYISSYTPYTAEVAPPPPPLFKHLMMHIKGILICKLKYKYLELV